MEKISLANGCPYREHWRYYNKVAYVHGVDILWCSKCNAVVLRKVDRSGPKTDYILKVVQILKNLIRTYDLKGKSLYAAWLINYITEKASFAHPDTVRNALGWLCLAHKQVRGLSLDGVIETREQNVMIKDDKIVPVEVYVIKPDISGDPEYLPIVFECPICNLAVLVGDVEYGENFTCPRCWSWFTWHATLTEPVQISPPQEYSVTLNVIVQNESGESIKNAQVTVANEDFPDFQYYTLTDDSGKATFNVPRWRKLAIKTIHEGYRDFTVKLMVASNCPTESLTIDLKKLTVWDYALPFIGALALICLPLIIIGAAESSKKK